MTSSSLVTIDNLIKNGDISLARQEIINQVKKRIARSDTVLVASLARRVELYDVALRLLNPIVRSTLRKLFIATPEEKVEYAASLVYIGAIDEANRTLLEVDPTITPEALFFRALSHFSSWDYKASIPLLNEFVRSPTINEYRRTIGRLNLAAALIHEENFDLAYSILTDLLRIAEKDNLVRLRGNTLELLAQISILSSDWKGAEHRLMNADRFLKSTGGIESFFIEKWKAIAALLKEGATSTTRLALQKICKRARGLGHWETLRQVDRFLAIKTRDKQLFCHLYVGTRYDSYRQRLLSDFGDVILPEKYRWYLGPRSNLPRILDLYSGSTSITSQPLNIGKLVHQLLIVLCSDFYRPFTLGDLTGKLYPGDFYNPVTSPLKIHRVMGRLRKWFSESKLPLIVHEENGRYSLNATRRCVIQIATARSRENPVLQTLRSASRDEPFLVEQVASVLGISRRSAYRVLKTALKENVITSSRKGREVYYRFHKKTG